MSRGLRLAILLGVLGLLVTDLVATRTHLLAASAHRVPIARPCLHDLPPALAQVDAHGLEGLKDTLRVAIAAGGDQAYDFGAMTVGDAWADNPPTRFERKPPNNLWPATASAYAWNPHLGRPQETPNVTVMQFPDAATAGRYWRSASAAACHRDGRTTNVPGFAVSRFLMWTNPLDYPQTDLWILRGRTVYLLLVVNEKHARMPVRIRDANVIGRLACGLPDSGCGAPAAAVKLGPART
jgi:hypothetical protein